MRVLLFLSLTVAGFAPAASAQLTAAKDAPVAMGHHHLLVSDADAHKKFWVDLLGAEHLKLGKTDVIKLPNALIFLKPDKPSAGTIGSSVNHIGFLVPSLKELMPKLKSAGVPVVTIREVSSGKATEDIYFNPGTQQKLAFVLAPDDVKIELIEDSEQKVPITNHHIHFATADIPAMQAWYAKMFGAKPGKRGQFDAADLPGVNLTFSGAPQPVEGTKGRSLDHIGFEVKDLKKVTERLEKEGVKFDIPYREIPAMNLKIAFFTDPWGNYVELTEGLDKL